MADPEKREPQDITEADKLRKELEESCPFYLNKSLEEWTAEEKKSFATKSSEITNNFYHKTVPGAIDDIKFSRTDMDSPIKIVHHLSEEQFTNQTTREDGRNSEKYLNGSYREFFENIRRALENRGVDMDELVKKYNIHHNLRLEFSDYYNQLTEQEKKPDENFRKLTQEISESVVPINFDIMPAFFDLMDGGYTQYDLSA